SRQEQQFLAALVRTHRRKIPKSAFDALPDRLLPSARRTAALLRIAALLHRSRDSEEIPRLDLLVDGPRMVLGLDRRWLHNRPLLRADLEGEPPQIAALGVQLEIATTSADAQPGRRHRASWAGHACAICASSSVSSMNGAGAEARMHYAIVTGTCPASPGRAGETVELLHRGLRQRGHRVSCVEPGQGTAARSHAP